MAFVKRKELWELRNKALDYDALKGAFSDLANDNLRMRDELSRLQEKLAIAEDDSRRWRDVAFRADELRRKALGYYESEEQIDD